VGFFSYNVPMKKKIVLRHRQIRHIEQLIEYGLHGEKLDARLVRKYWEEISMENSIRKYFAFLLWPQKYQSHYLPYERAAEKALFSINRKSRKLKREALK